MREILFRGKTKEDGEWAYGFYVNCASTYDDPETDRVAEIIELDADRIYQGEYCSLATHPVIPETVGQWTGLVDKNGIKIFEGDIIECSMIYDIGCYPHTKTERKVVVYREGCFNPLYDCERNSYKVIGNIHDDPELLEEK